MGILAGGFWLRSDFWPAKAGGRAGGRVQERTSACKLVILCFLLPTIDGQGCVGFYSWNKIGRSYKRTVFLTLRPVSRKNLRCDVLISIINHVTWCSEPRGQEFGCFVTTRKPAARQVMPHKALSKWGSALQLRVHAGIRRIRSPRRGDQPLSLVRLALGDGSAALGAA